MSTEKNDEASTSESKQSEQSEPGPTPGSAEGDRETVEEDLREKGGMSDGEDSESE